MKHASVRNSLVRIGLQVTEFLLYVYPRRFLTRYIRRLRRVQSLLPLVFDLLHLLRAACPLHAGFFGGTVEFRMEVVASIQVRFDGLDIDAVRIGPGVLANAGHLPGNFDVRFVGVNDESIVGDLTRDDRLRELADHGQLVAEVAIEGLEITGQLNDCLACGVGCDVAVVNVFHVWRLDSCVLQKLIGRIQRMIHLHDCRRAVHSLGSGDLTLEKTGVGREIANGTASHDRYNSVSAAIRGVCNICRSGKIAAISAEIGTQSAVRSYAYASIRNCIRIKIPTATENLQPGTAILVRSVRRVPGLSKNAGCSGDV